MAKARICRKTSFESKKGDVYYKLTLLQELTAKQEMNGDSGYVSAEYFVDKEVYDSVDNKIVRDVPLFDVEYAVSGTRISVASLKPCK